MGAVPLFSIVNGNLIAIKAPDHNKLGNFISFVILIWLYSCIPSFTINNSVCCLIRALSLFMIGASLSY